MAIPERRKTTISLYCTSWKNFPYSSKEFLFCKILEEILDEELIKLVTEQTNLYAAQFFDNDPELKPRPRIRKWKDTNEAEMKIVSRAPKYTRNNWKTGFGTLFFKTNNN